MLIASRSISDSVTARRHPAADGGENANVDAEASAAIDTTVRKAGNQGQRAGQRCGYDSSDRKNGKARESRG